MSRVYREWLVENTVQYPVSGSSSGENAVLMPNVQIISEGTRGQNMKVGYSSRKLCPPNNVASKWK